MDKTTEQLRAEFAQRQADRMRAARCANYEPDPAPVRHQIPPPRRETAKEHAQALATQAFLDAEKRDEEELAAINAAVKDTWLNLSRPEPKSIYSPAPSGPIRREAPKRRNPFTANVRNPDGIVGVRSREYVLGHGSLIGGPRGTSIVTRGK